MSWTKVNLIIILLFILHLVGGVALSLESVKSMFLVLTPFNLALTFGLLIWGNDDFSYNFFKVISVLFLIGFFVEVLGVNSGLLFGEYHYGKTLGFQFLGVPLIIGLNWVLLVVSSFAVSSYFVSNSILKVVLPSVIMVLLDLMIEPVAIRLDFWHWQAEVIPLQNYIMWFFVALLMNWILTFNRFKFNVKLGFGLLISQVLFFTLQSFNC
ncbi:MAG: carotenoid biosynthesis protein [Flavobacteriales bacterium]|nr:carotenoid biosynthesis protein [Flavobacteriales bacterium]